MDTDTLAGLAKQLDCAVYFGEPLSKHTTFRIGGACDCMIMPNSVEALSKLIAFASKNGIRTLVIGKGSNMLCADEGFDGAVLLLGKDFSSIEQVGENILRAQAGASLMQLCSDALTLGLSGLEFAYGIPGTVGGAVYMNAGAYGGEIKDVLISVTAMDKNGNIKVYGADELELSYRRSRFTESGEIIVSGDFKLAPASRESIKSKMEELMGRRREKQPLEYPNAGSTFKRPEGQFAGRLIQDCGLRGLTVGGAQVSEKHCGFVINKCSATCEDVKQLISAIQKTVFDKTGFELECEVKIIPYKEDSE